ncbi:hypothetical protein CASFOL_025495 [Castilleja foliolosa]|uniref:Alpha-carbonic anhydrase domain-containing protein n=1 Tax=Castilleja foliolosa TaxID=1961234 RepID=A0ABD3CR99_9LAMI
MGMNMLRPVFFITCLVFMAVNADNNHPPEEEDESLFAYESKNGKGPEVWGDLSPKWKACKKGTIQSPIDLTDDGVLILPTIGRLRRKYKLALAIMKNRGHDIMVEFEGDAGGAVINGTEYRLQQVHWHTPAEHSRNRIRYEMEVHLVHNNSLGQIAVIGVVYKFGRKDRFLAKLLNSGEAIDHNGTRLGLINPWEIKFGSRKYYLYKGSLTVPPCTGVIWAIIKKVRTVSREQIKALREMVHDGYETNARPIQRLNKRAVFMYRPQLS